MNAIIADLLTNPLMVQVAIFGMAAAASWWFLDFIAGKKPRAEERLEEIREPNSRKIDMLR